MKKIILTCVVIVIAVSMSFSAFAATGGFISSPSGKKAPELISFSNSSDDCEAEIIITAYGDRHELSEESRKQIEEAYLHIIGTQDITSLSEALAALAKERNVDVADIAVSELFDISATECNGHADHGHFDITIKPESLNNFFALLHYYNGVWRVVDNAEVTHDGTHLEFDEYEFSPFAIVVYTGEDVLDTDSAPTTDDIGGGNDDSDGGNVGKTIGIVIACVVVLASVVAAVWYYLKKVKK